MGAEQISPMRTSICPKQPTKALTNTKFSEVCARANWGLMHSKRSREHNEKYTRKLNYRIRRERHQNTTNVETTQENWLSQFGNRLKKNFCTN